MKLAEKQVYPSSDFVNNGITFRERLIIALASNSSVTSFVEGVSYKNNIEINVRAILEQADAIIAEMEK